MSSVDGVLNSARTFALSKLKEQAESEARTELRGYITNKVTKTSNPLISSDKLSSKSFFGTFYSDHDVRGYLKKTLKDLLHKNYPDVARGAEFNSDSTINGKSGQVFKTTKAYVFHQLWTALTSLSTEELKTININENLITSVQELLSQIREQNSLKIDSQRNTHNQAQKIEKTEYEDKAKATDDQIDDMYQIERETAQTEQAIYTLKVQLKNNIVKLLQCVSQTKIEQNKKNEHLFEIIDFAKTINQADFIQDITQASGQSVSKSDVFLDDFIEFEDTKLKVEKDPDVRDRLTLLPYEFLISPETAISYLLQLGQTGKTLLCSFITTEYIGGYKDSTQILAKGAYYIYSLLGYKERDFLIYEKTENGAFSPKSHIVKRLRQMIASIPSAEKRKNIRHYIFGHSNSKGQKNGFLKTFQDEVKSGFRFWSHKSRIDDANSNVTHYLKQRIDRLADLSGSEQLVFKSKTPEQRGSSNLNWERILAYSQKIETRKREREKAVKKEDSATDHNKHELLKNRIDNACSLINQLKNLIKNSPLINEPQSEQKELDENSTLIYKTQLEKLDNLLGQLKELQVNKIPLVEYLKDVEPDVFKSLQQAFNELKRKNANIDNKLLRAWSSFKDLHLLSQQNIFYKLARNSTTIVGINAIKGDGAQEITTNRLLKKSEEVALKAKEFKKKLAENESLQFLRNVLAEAQIFKYILSSNTPEAPIDVDKFINIYLSNAAEMLARRKSLRNLSAEYLKKVLTEDKYKILRDVLVIKFTVDGKNYEYNLGSKKVFINGVEQQNFKIDASTITNGNIDIDENSHLAQLDDKTKEILNTIDSLVFQINTVTEKHHKAVSEIKTKFHKTTLSFLQKIIPKEGIEKYQISHKAYTEKLAEFQKQKEMLIAYRKTDYDFKLLQEKKEKLEEILLTKNSEDKGVVELKQQIAELQNKLSNTNIANLQENIKQSQNEIDKLRTEIRTPANSAYTEFLEIIFTSANTLATSTDDAFTISDSNKENAIFLRTDDGETLPNINEMKLFDGFFFRVSEYEKPKQSGWANFGQKLYELLGKEVVNPDSFFQNPENQSIIEEFVSDVLGFQSELTEKIDEQTREIMTLVAVLNKAAQRDSVGRSKEDKQDDNDNNLRPMKIMQNAIAKFDSNQDEIFKVLRATHSEYLDNKANEKRHLLTFEHLHEDISQEFIEDHLEYGCNKLIEVPVEENGDFNDASFALYTSPGVWENILPHKTYEADEYNVYEDIKEDEEYHNELTTMISLLGTSQQIAFNSSDPNDKENRKQYYAMCRKITEICIKNNYKVFKINWGQTKEKFKAAFSKMTTIEGINVCEIINKTYKLLKEFSELLINPRIHVSLETIKNKMKEILPLLVDISKIKNITTSEKELLEECFNYLKFGDMETFKKIIEEHYQTEAYQKSQDEFEVALKKIFTILSEKEAEAKLDGKTRPTSVGRVGSSDATSAHRVSKVQQQLNATMNSIKSYNLEANKCFKGINSISDKDKKEIFLWKRKQINFKELDREIRIIQNLQYIASLNENVGLRIMTLKCFLTKYNLLHDFLLIEGVIATLEDQKELSNAEKKKFLKSLKRITNKLYNIMIKEKLIAQEETILEGLVNAINTILPEKFQVALNEKTINNWRDAFSKNPIWEQVYNKEMDSSWGEFFKTPFSAAADSIAQKLVQSDTPHATAVLKECSHYVKGYRLAFQVLQSKQKDVSFDSMLEYLINITKNIDTSINIFNKFNKNLTAVNEFLKNSNQFSELISKNNSLLTLSQENQAFKFFYNNHYNKNLFLISVETMSEFNKNFLELKKKTILLSSKLYSIIDLLELDEPKRNFLTEQTLNNFKFSDLITLTLNRKTNVKLKCEQQFFNFELSLDDNNEIITSCNGIKFDISAHTFTEIAENIKINTALEQEYNSTLTLVNKNIATLNKNYNLKVNLKNFNPIHLTTEQLISDHSYLKSLLSKLQEQSRNLVLDSIKVNILDESPKIYYIDSSQNSFEEITLISSKNDHDDDDSLISVAFKHQGQQLFTLENKKGFNILTAIQNAIKNKEATSKLAAEKEAKRIQEEAKILAYSNKLQNKYEASRKRCNTQKIAVNLLTSLGVEITTNAELKQLVEFNINNLFLPTEEFSKQHSIYKRDIKRRLAELEKQIEQFESRADAYEKLLNGLFISKTHELSQDGIKYQGIQLGEEITALKPLIDILSNLSKNNDLLKIHFISEKTNSNDYEQFNYVFKFSTKENTLSLTTTGIRKKDEKIPAKKDNLGTLFITPDDLTIPIERLANDIWKINAIIDNANDVKNLRAFIEDEFPENYNIKPCLNSITCTNTEPGVITLKLTTYEKKLTLSLSKKKTCYENIMELRHFINKINESRLELKLNIKNDIVNNIEKFSPGSLPVTALKAVLPAQLILNTKGEIQYSHNTSSLQNSLTSLQDLQNSLESLQDDQRKCCLIHNELGDTLGMLDFLFRKEKNQIEILIFGGNQKFVELIDELIRNKDSWLNKLIKAPKTLLKADLNTKIKKALPPSKNTVFSNSIQPPIACLKDFENAKRETLIVQALLEATQNREELKKITALYDNEIEVLKINSKKSEKLKFLSVLENFLDNDANPILAAIDTTAENELQNQKKQMHEKNKTIPSYHVGTGLMGALGYIHRAKSASASNTLAKNPLSASMPLPTLQNIELDARIQLFIGLRNEFVRKLDKNNSAVLPLYDDKEEIPVSSLRSHSEPLEINDNYFLTPASCRNDDSKNKKPEEKEEHIDGDCPTVPSINTVHPAAHPAKPILMSPSNAYLVVNKVAEHHNGPNSRKAEFVASQSFSLSAKSDSESEPDSESPSETPPDSPLSRSSNSSKNSGNSLPPSKRSISRSTSYSLNNSASSTRSDIQPLNRSDSARSIKSSGSVLSSSLSFMENASLHKRNVSNDKQRIVVSALQPSTPL